MSRNSDEVAVLNLLRSDRRGALDYMDFARRPQHLKMKYEPLVGWEEYGPFERNAEHDKWVERQLELYRLTPSVQVRDGPLPSVRMRIYEAIDQLTEEAEFFANSDKPKEF